MEINTAIEQVERLYTAITGREPEPIADDKLTPIPPERDPAEFVQQQMDRLIERLATVTGNLGAGASQALPIHTAPPASIPRWVPSLSIWEGPDVMVACLDLPGVTRTSIKMTVRDGLLEITGERPIPRHSGGALVARWQESGLGTFFRTIPLRSGTSTEQVSAELADGVLKITITQRARRDQAIELG